MTGLCIISIIIATFYASLIWWIYQGWRQTQNKVSSTSSTQTGVSVIIPVRNEATGILQCIRSVLNNNYPAHLFEILVIDDHSTDKTAELVQSVEAVNLRYYLLSEDVTGKKRAITFGVQLARFPIILCTDGDSQVSQLWIQEHNNMYSNDNLQICSGPVLPQQFNSLLGTFQWLDFASMMAVTANGLFRNCYALSNGANLSYRKTAFIHYKGFEGNFDRASGDDIYLIQKMTRETPESAGFLTGRNGLVTTKSESSWTDFFHQRKRWASKAMSSFDSRVKWVQGFIFAYTLCMTILIPLGIIATKLFLIPLIIILATKMVVDYLFLKRLSVSYSNLYAMQRFLPAFFIYMLHILLSGWYALVPPAYNWKGRNVK